MMAISASNMKVSILQIKIVGESNDLTPTSAMPIVETKHNQVSLFGAWTAQALCSHVHR